MKLPCRKTTGDPANIRRAVAVQRRLHAIGKEYRAAVPRVDRSYRRWLEFLHAREPLLVRRGVDGTEAIWKASLRV